MTGLSFMAADELANGSNLLREIMPICTEFHRRPAGASG